MRLLLKIFKGLLLIVILIVVTYLLGPKVDEPNLNKALPEVPADLVQLEKWINQKEREIPNIKPENEARIVWFDSIPTKTEYSLVYIHGWSASSKEGDPIHKQTARRYGCNLYLPRLAGHGLKEKEGMLDLTADEVLDSAKEAIAIAKQLGNKVIIMATSTGGTLALHLAGNDPDIAGLLLYSPNIEIYDQSAKLLAGPWGIQLAKAVKDSDYYEFEATEEKKKYWTTKYRMEALTQLQTLVDNTMIPETFQQVTQPTFLGYFFKNDSIQDNVVSVPAMLEMYDMLGTAPDLKRKKAFPETGDHVMTCSITSKDLKSVQKETEKFLEEIIGLRPMTTDLSVVSQE
ncbi:alpha/beta fold hydrolase [uncultured Allomuricauda sp.]|uniref:alpha/beta hydrolase n=1 Tax=Flagellimonas sp. W118 TaxID=3410791 RepID=UPI002615FBDA|nr:alpha/beta hydrolase [uncultured Allomuricauda sp.]